MCQMDILACPPNGTRLDIELEVGNVEDGALLDAVPAKQRFDAGDQFGKGERRSEERRVGKECRL